MHIVRGDQVMVQTGKDRGKRGTVVRVLPKEHRAVVEGLNLVKKHLKPTPKHPHGGIVELAAPIHASNLLPICAECGKPTRVGIKRTDAGAIRMCRRCGQALNATQRTEKSSKKK
ncbi:50S ribosomal protein L24 [Candidatus Berkelbacteria bacterium]|nr:50S ribosomal protein L24 [Candidatus Berkelbacteria bacterium]